MLNDWTYDEFMEDAKLYHETPFKGVHVPTDNYRRYFMVWFKNHARDFKVKWFETHEHLYDRYDGYIGDAFARTLEKFPADLRELAPEKLRLTERGLLFWDTIATELL